MVPLPTADRVIHWETHRGRNSEFDKTEAGTGTLVLRNRDGLFDALNPDSPYTVTHHLQPVRQVRITTSTPAHPGTYHDIFTGYVESWDFERMGPRGATATVQLMDGFELLNNAQVFLTKNQTQGGHYFERAHVDDRIRAALQFAGWPGARRSIFTGNVEVQAITYPPGSSMLQVIQDAAEAEFPGLANFYIDKTGNACFRGRNSRLDPFNTAWNTSKSRAARLWTFGDDEAIATYDTEDFPFFGEMLPLANLQWSLTKEHLYNVVQVIPANMDPKDYWKQTVSDSVLAKRHGKRDLTINGLLVRTGDGPPGQLAREECKRIGLFFLQNYKNPEVRANQLEVHSKFEDARIWDFLVNVELGDVVALYTINPGGGGFFGEHFFVDGIHNSVDAIGDWPQWVGTYDLTPRQYYGFFPDPYGSSFARGGAGGYAYPDGTQSGPPENANTDADERSPEEEEWLAAQITP